MFPVPLNSLRKVAFLLLLAISPTPAQQITGMISGTVVDPSGQVIVSAEVTLQSADTGETRVTRTSDSGTFTFPSVQPGNYSLKVTHEGFKTLIRSGLVLTANERLSAGNLMLSIGTVGDHVTVAAIGDNVETASSDHSALLTSNQLNMIMARGRNIISLLRTMPGVSYGGDPDSPGGAYGDSTPNIAGTRSYLNSIAVDGTPGMDFGTPSTYSSAINMDAVAEMKVLLNNYQAEYGLKGGAMVNVVTKSGTREFHGTGYWYKRHEQFNANSFFSNLNSVSKSRYRYDTLGATLGGPVPLKLAPLKDKLFFFYSFENWMTQQPVALQRVTTPTALERVGDFSQTLDVSGKQVPIYDPATHTVFPGNVIPASRMDQNGRALFNILPMPNFFDRSISGGSYNYTFQESLHQPKRQHLFRIDYSPTDRDRLYVRGMKWWQDQQGYCVAAGGSCWGFMRQHYTFTDDSLALDYTRVISPTLVNEFNGGARHSTEAGPPITPQDLQNVTRKKIGFNAGQLYPGLNPLDIVPRITWGVPSSANVTYDGRFPIRGQDTGYNFSNNLSWTRGSHSAKFGIYLMLARNTEGERGVFAGSFDFSRDVNNPFDSNYGYSNSLLGNFTSYTESSSRPPTLGQRDILEWFAQDSWKIGRRLTLEYGMRWSWYDQWKQRDGQAAAFSLERYQRSGAPALFQPAIGPTGKRQAQNPITGEFFPAVLIGAFVPNSGNPVNGMVVATDPTYPRGFMDPPGISWGPRFGFAYDVFGNGKTAMRGGFGIFYQSLTTGNFVWNLVNDPPVQFNPVEYYGNLSTFTQTNGVLFPGTVYGFNKQNKTAATYSSSFGIQQNLGFATILDVSYAGTLGRHLNDQRNLNTVPYGAHFLPQNADPTNPSTPLPDNFYRPYPGLGTIWYYENASSSNYHALQVSVNRRFTEGLQFGVAYTWSKAMDFVDQDQSTVAMYAPLRVWNYGKAGFDQTHNLVVNFMYDIPKATSLVKSRPIGWFFDNWQVAGVLAFVSGTPSGVGFSTVDGADISGGGDGSRIVVTGKAQKDRGDRSFSEWFNTSVFARPPKGSMGNAPKDVFRNPGTNNLDFSVFKNIPIRSEKRHLQYRMEMYNALNHTQFSGVDATARFDASGKQVNPTFGRVTSARSPRVIQMALRFEF
jgi:hypothetical protein